MESIPRYEHRTRNQTVYPRLMHADGGTRGCLFRRPGTWHLVKSLVYAKFDRGHRWPISRGFRRWRPTGLSLLVDQESRTTTAGCRDILKYLVESTAPDRVVPLVRVPAVPITFLFATPSSRAAENRIAGANKSGPKLRWAVPLGIFSVPLSRTDKA